MASRRRTAGLHRRRFAGFAANRGAIVLALLLATLLASPRARAAAAPLGAPEQAEAKERAVEAANKDATLVPLEVLERSVEAVRLARTAAAKGNRNSLSDAGVAGLAAQAAGDGAWYNVLINLQGIRDAAFAARVRRQAAGFKKALDKEGRAVREIVAKALTAPKPA